MNKPDSDSLQLLYKRRVLRKMRTQRIISIDSESLNHLTKIFFTSDLAYFCLHTVIVSYIINIVHCTYGVRIQMFYKVISQASFSS